MVNNYQFEPDEFGKTCIIPGLRCPFGWRVIEDGSNAGAACELINQVCEKNYELNPDKTACVPISTFYIPFPILITLATICLIPIISKIKWRKTLIVPCFTIFIAFLETVCMLVMVAQAYEYGITTTFYLAIVGLVFTFASNMFFTLMYC
jgi:hypothetical protein